MACACPSPSTLAAVPSWRTLQVPLGPRARPSVWEKGWELLRPEVTGKLLEGRSQGDSLGSPEKKGHSSGRRKGLGLGLLSFLEAMNRGLGSEWGLRKKNLVGKWGGRFLISWDLGNGGASGPIGQIGSQNSLLDPVLLAAHPHLA